MTLPAPDTSDGEDVSGSPNAPAADQHAADQHAADAGQGTGPLADPSPGDACELSPVEDESPQRWTAAGIPRIPASAGAMVWDRKGRLLVLKPTYKGGWTLPGGIVEAGGESPWEACRREVLEECGLDIASGRLVCVDFLHPRNGKPGGVRFLFDVGVLDDEVLRHIVLQQDEISEHRIVRVKTALELLSGPVRRRVSASLASASTLTYLEDGRPLPESGSPGR